MINGGESFSGARQRGRRLCKVRTGPGAGFPGGRERIVLARAAPELWVSAGACGFLQAAGLVTCKGPGT
ncbi:MAG: hypothetical protein A3F83_12805 [Candidatus Glassbacteria bacterium RIFCSPLOWO2_12_FULL_58_11]|uniref:Uncharacterized protein n=1 Tax=Candidatus Glassbacteria bacterium RIFCSPLOWO2_12_FULL_58_11 TaxID=1817867 RepID=A0A1F5YMC2_9BACT|nr:MAG: hypothetical protein A3F83_12805 [Candidatus Glassbacteria bacterium RIFCSPLOWO2_12_FULL_58_11]